MKELTYHPVAEMFPLMQGVEFEDLVEDIRKHGQRHSCLKTGNQIIDGRNRYRAMQKLGKKCRFDEWDGRGSLTEISCSLNFHRRHLTPSQRAATGAIAEEEFAKEADARMKSGKHPVEKIPEGQAGRARDLAAKACGVNARYISDAKAVRQHDPALFAKLVDGSVTITVAAREVHRARKRDANKPIKPATNVGVGTFDILVGDHLEKLAEQPLGKARLVFIDPPYNIGVDYGRGVKADSLPPEKYLAHHRKLFTACREMLTPDGSLWVLINHEWAAEFCIALKDMGMHLRRWITWYETFGNNCRDNFNRTSRFLLYFTVSETDFVFDHRAVNRPSDRQLKYGDKRAATGGKNHDDVWIIPRLVDNAVERLPDFPTQLPRELLRRVVGCATEPGDLVIDPCNGSGTTGSACIELGRQYLGVERNKQFANWSHARLEREAATVTARSGK